MKVKFGSQELEYPDPNFGTLRESNDVLSDPAELRSRMVQDGYLFMRNLISPDAVRNARRRIFEYMAERDAFVAGEPVLEGVMPKGGKTVNLLGNKAITHEREVVRVFEAPELFAFFEALYGEEAITFDYKWLRAVGNEKFTGSHYDVVYMGRGSNRVNTVWLPLGDIPVAHGTLAICEGSHKLEGFSKLRETYGKMDVDRDHVEGWFSEDPVEILEKFGGRWLTADMQSGDMLTFGLYTLHASTTNTTNKFRLSCDVRYQPASEKLDERWAGNKPKGHYALSAGPTVTMAEARAKWQI